jgi:hypothetical protein
MDDMLFDLGRPISTNSTLQGPPIPVFQARLRRNVEDQKTRLGWLLPSDWDEVGLLAEMLEMP